MGPKFPCKDRVPGRLLDVQRALARSILSSSQKKMGLISSGTHPVDVYEKTEDLKLRGAVIPLFFGSQDFR